MVECILDILEDYHNKKAYADEDFVLAITGLIANNYDLNDYIKDISFINDKLGPNNRYSYFYNVIQYNLVKLDNPKYFRKLQENYYGYFNLQVLKTILHELEHVDQEKIKDYGKGSLESKILLLADPNTYIETINIDTTSLEERIIKLKRRKFERFYDRNYRKAPNERLAIIYSCLDIGRIIETDFIKNSGYYQTFSELNSQDLSDILFENYHLKGKLTNSPTIEYLRKQTRLNKEFIKQDKSFYDLSIPAEDRLLLGLPLTNEECLMINNVEKSLVKKRNFI